MYALAGPGRAKACSGDRAQVPRSCCRDEAISAVVHPKVCFAALAMTRLCRTRPAQLNDMEAAKMRVVGIDHLSIRVSDFEKSKQFYSRLFGFLGFDLSDEYDDVIGWTNGKTRFWISPADAQGRRNNYRIGDVGFHHYAFQLRSRKDVDELQAFLVEELGATIVDPAAEYYDDYYAVFFLDPDGMKLEGMKYGERHAQATRRKSPARARPASA
jgi:catechol 2,3-dioxygenase-like lactoylglutathione lyase family enzyme